MPWLRSGAASVADFAGLVEWLIGQLARSLHRPAHIVGHDLGGVALYWLAQTGFCDAIRSAMFVSSPHPSAYGRFVGTQAGRLRTGYIDRILAVDAESGLRACLLPDVTGDDGAIVTEIGSAIDATDLQGLQGIYRLIRQVRPPGPQDYPGQDYPGIKAPCALAYSEGDRFMSDALMTDSARCFGPATRTLCLEGDSHYPHMTHPRALARFMEDFWNDAERA